MLLINRALHHQNRRRFALAEADYRRAEKLLANFSGLPAGLELARLRVHLGELRVLLDGGAAVGRTMDFLIQEINREVNTVGSKADDLEISQAVIAAKSTLEKIREQVQNIE